MVAILDIETEQLEQFWISMSSRYLPSSISSIRLTVREMLFKEFQDGWHLGYLNWTNWAILNFLVIPIPLIKFQLNLTFCSRDVFLRISRWPPSWISKRNKFSNSESPCRFDTSYQVSAQSDLPFGRRCHNKEFKDGRAFLISERNEFLQF